MILMTESEFDALIREEIETYLTEASTTQATQLSKPRRKSPIGQDTRNDKKKQLLRRNIDKHVRLLKFYARILRDATTQPQSPEIQTQFAQMRKYMNNSNTPEFLKQFDIASDRDLLKLRVGFDAVEQGLSSRTKNHIKTSYDAALNLADRAVNKMHALYENLTESQVALLEQNDPDADQLMKDVESFMRRVDSKRQHLKSAGPPESADVIDRSVNDLEDQLTSFATNVQQHVSMQADPEPHQQMSEMFDNESPQKKAKALRKKAARVQRWAMRAREEGRTKDYQRWRNEVDKLQAAANGIMEDLEEETI